MNNDTEKPVFRKRQNEIRLRGFVLAHGSDKEKTWFE